MENNVVQFIGTSCGQHGPYSFYKAFKYKKNGVNRIVTLGEFFFVKLWIDTDLLCIGELQLLWFDKNSEQNLASLRLYFLPENTPEGRMDHGEDEVLAIAEKVVLRVEDLVTWITVDAEWTWGRLGRCSKQVKEPPDESGNEAGSTSLSESSLDFTDVQAEKHLLERDEGLKGPSVVILSYPKYCRYRAMMRRLEGVEDQFLKHNIVMALGGFSFASDRTRVMFCRDTFEYPDLEGHELLCNHLAPKLKGRPRGKRKKRSVSPGSESNESECSVVTSYNAKTKDAANNKNGICLDSSLPRRSTRSSDNSDSKEFLKKLNSFMKMKRTPLGRTPCLGSKEIDLHDFYTKVQKMGGYDCLTSNRQWKTVSDDMSGNQQTSGAASIVKRHYERFLLPYERHIKGEEYKPLPVSERRRLKSKSVNNVARSENSNHVDRNVVTHQPTSPKSSTENSKETNGTVKQEPKVSSLRSVRVKPERQKEKFAKVVKMEDISSDKDSLEIIKIENTPAVKPEVKVEEKPEEKVAVKIEIPTLKEEKTVKTPINKDIPVTIEKREKDVVIVVSSSSSVDSSLEEIKQELADKPITVVRAPFIDELRKDKLDILKEGGLEVTPVCSGVEVFKKSLTKISSPIERLPINIPQSLNISKVTVPSSTPTSKIPYQYPEKTDSTTPPKVLQSRSMFSSCGNTVYGNPKDCLGDSFPVHIPKTPVNFMRPPTGGDLLDLTVASPQKPILDTRVPSLPSTATSTFHFNNSTKNLVKAANLPIFEGRKLGSNLEITLVDSKEKANSTFSREAAQGSKVRKMDYSVYKVPNKVSVKVESYRKENGDSVKPSTSRAKRLRDEAEGNNVSVSKRPSVAETVSNPKYFQQNVPFPYLSQLYEGNKGVSPYYPMIDPLLYSAALQSLYPQTATSPMMFTSQEHLKFYSELMAQQSRMPFPFRLPTDEEFSNNNTKK